MILPENMYGPEPGPDESKPDPAVVAELARMLLTMERTKLALVGLIVLCLCGAFASTYFVRAALLWSSFGVSFGLAIICGLVLRGVSKAYWQLHAKYDRLLCLGAYYEMMEQIGEKP